MAVLSVWLRVGALVVGLLSVVAGCAGPEQPTDSCTPETGGAPFPCYKAQWELYQKQDRLYTEAETVYRKFIAEEERIFRIGGVTKLTPVLEETTTGNFQKYRLKRYLDMGKTRTHLTGGTFVVAWIKRKPAALEPGSAVALDICVEGSAATFQARGQADWAAANTRDTFQFVKERDLLKISSALGESVESC